MSLQGLMRRFTIRLRMLGAIGVVLALLAFVGGAGLWGMSKLSDINQALFEHANGTTLALSRLQLSLGDLGRHESEMVVHYESPVALTQAQERWEAASRSIQTLLEAMSLGQEPPQKETTQAVQASLALYAAAVKPVIQQMISGAFDTATDANRMLARAQEHRASMADKVALMEQAILAEAAALQESEQAASHQMRWAFGIALAAAMLVVVPSTLANMTSICDPLDDAQRLASAIASGDLTQPVPLVGRDELTTLMRALGDMQTSLARIVAEVRRTSDSIGVASAEIASGNQDLSNRTEQAAGNLQQTASSLEQINGTTHQSADAARQASDMAQSNAVVAARGGQVVGEVVAMMDEINHSSRQISDIIGVIDGIAFQTNILALNAAVEAARAGEQGRGFAVVAAEVRSLAQRSAAAAREIKGLIGASVGKVEEGTRLVAEAGSTIGEIVDNARKVSDFISDITTAANEQSQGIGQVNQAVGRLDQMTQQNAALVEQSAAAAASLKDQAHHLAGVVATFRLQAG